MSQSFFISVEEFKTLMSISTISIVFNSKTGKKSILLPDGTFVRVQQDYDKTKPLKFLTTSVDEFGEPNWFDACLVNVNNSSPLTETDSL